MPKKHPISWSAFDRSLDAAVCRSVLIVLMLFFCVASLQAEPQPPDPPPLEAPKPHSSQVSSSEGLPPLPYPVVAMKRQEKKNPPTPAVLITKIRTQDPEDWARTPNDVKGLLGWMSSEMKVSFSSNVKKFNDVSMDANDNPILYRSGYKPFTLNRKQIEHLREYVLGGGTIIFNALVGNPNFYRSALQAAHEILPESPTYRLRMDHPVFHSFYDIGEVSFRERLIKDGVASDPRPWIEGADIDNRTAIFVSRWDFSLGWEANPHDSWGYADADARKLGGNLISYVTAMRAAGQSVGQSVELSNVDQQTAGKFRVTQVIHNGVWKTRPAALPMLLKAFHDATGAPVSFEVREANLADPAIYESPFLYLTGTTDFSLSEEQRAGLRKFLQNGGVLFVEAGEGRQSFDAAFRAEMQKVLPGHELSPLKPGSDLLHQPMQVSSATLRPALAAQRENQTKLATELYGIELHGAYAVIYSPYDLSAGWEHASAPYALGYEPRDATALGVNVLYYAVTH